MGAFSSKSQAYIIFEVSLCHPDPQTCRMFILSKQRSGHIIYPNESRPVALLLPTELLISLPRCPTLASSPPLVSPSSSWTPHCRRTASGEGYSGGGLTWGVEEVDDAIEDGMIVALHNCYHIRSQGTA